MATCEVETLIHQQMANFDVHRLVDGYEVTHPSGTCRLRFIPIDTECSDGMHLDSIAEITTEFSVEWAPEYTLQGLALLNARAVHGAYVQTDAHGLAVRAQYSLYRDEPAAHLAALLILEALSGQQAIGYGLVAASKSEEALWQQRAYLECPRRWEEPFPTDTFERVAEQLSSRGIVSTPRRAGLTAEVALSGDIPSRMFDPKADTALLTVQTDSPHPIAGVGYLATLALPVDPDAESLPKWCDQLNRLEWQKTDFVPRLGAWGVREAEDALVYSMFLPFARPYSDLHRTIALWMVHRALWLKELGWNPQSGLPTRWLAESVT